MHSCFLSTGKKPSNLWKSLPLNCSQDVSSRYQCYMPAKQTTNNFTKIVFSYFCYHSLTLNSRFWGRFFVLVLVFFLTNHFMLVNHSLYWNWFLGYLHNFACYLSLRLQYPFLMYFDSDCKHNVLDQIYFWEWYINVQAVTSGGEMLQILQF